MATISERVQQLHAQVRAYAEHANASQKARKFTEHAETVRELRGRLDHALAIILVLKRSDGLTAAELVPVRNLPTPDNAKDGLRAVSEKLITAPLSLHDGREFVTFKQRFEKITINTEEALGKTITHIKQGSPTVDETFLKQVETIPPYDALVRDIRSKRDAFWMATLSDISTIQIFLDRRAALRVAVDALAPDEFPQAVVDFFKSARRGNGAPIELLTDDVRAWLKQRDLLKKIRITVTG
jgi:hypothetical protein